jgi:release factor glutamine methyltransferase
MIAHAWLKRATERLQAAGIGTARLDCLVLLEDVTDKNRAHWLAHPETKLTDEQLKRLNLLLGRRARHQPLAYVRGKTEFYGRSFAVNKRVLEPRPESETMIELLKKVSNDNKSIADIGTGSGALAITAKLELPDTQVSAVDIDPGCLKVARSNSKSLNAEITLLEGDLLMPLSKTPDIILANLPYVPDTYHINEAAMEEPRLAIFGGPDGLDLYRRMFEQIHALPSRPQFVLTESLPFQHHSLATIARAHGYIQDQKDDFIQLFSLRLA